MTLVPSQSHLIFIFDLPHILQTIGQFLPGPDIQSCALVCHSWSLIFVPLCWTKFSLSNRDYDHLLSHPGSKSLFDKRVHTIRDLSIHGHSCIAPFESHIMSNPELFSNQLTRICYVGHGFVVDENGEPAIREYHHDNPTTTSTIDMFLEIMERNANNLADLELWMYHWNLGFVRKLTSLFTRLTSLKTAILMGNQQNPMELQHLVLILQFYPGSLESLEINYASTFYCYDGFLSSHGEGRWEDTPYWSGDGVNAHAWYWNQVKPSNLQKLILSNPQLCIFPEKTCPVIQPFLHTRGGKLKSFRLPRMNPGPKTFAAALERCVELRELEIDRIEPAMAELYRAAIKACQRLESLVVSGSVEGDVRDVVNTVVSTHASSMKRIKWTGGGGFDGKLNLEVFLRACPNLERLETTFGSLYNFVDQGAEGGLRIRDEPLPTFPTVATTSMSTSKDDLDISLSSLTLEEPSSTSTATPTAESSTSSASSSSSLSPSPSSQTSVYPTLPLESYWPCHRTLTYLDVSFYPDRKITDEKRFREQIEHAYKKIGQLQQLVTLHLGCVCRCEGPHLVYCVHSRWDYEQGDPEIVTLPAPQSAETLLEQSTYYPMSVLLAGPQDGVILDMSLATGLGHLSGLKKLRLLNISKIMGHKVGYPELEWMKENWPDLEEFYGTRNAKLREWIQEHWPGLKV
ncbi:hypothetical protein BGZ79_005944 [Entomortierella chlamydospora]|nr:hypothetical protein BGZ79_005944 [Entomortierella chlamydospora]